MGNEETKPIKIYLNANLEERFRKSAMGMYGYGKGALSKAAESAVEHWCASVSIINIDTSDIKNPIEAIEGMLAEEKKSSVEVQHEISKIWAQKVNKELEEIRKKRK